jgi:hypothetical protein
MHNKAIEIIKSFAKKEINEFRKFLKSPYFNSSEMVIKLYELLLQFYPNFDDDNLSYDYLMEKLYESKQVPISTIDSLFSRLSHLAEKFLIQKGFERTNKLEYACLLDEIQARKIESLYNKTLSEAEKNNSSFADSNEDFFINRSRIETSKYNIKAAEGQTRNNKDINYETNCLLNASKYMICHFIFEVFKSNLITQNYYQTYNIDKKSDYISVLLEKINIAEMLIAAMKNPGFREYHFLFEIYYYIHLSLTDQQNESHYHVYKSLLLKNSKKINADENNFLYSTLLDYCLMKNTPEFYEEWKKLFELFLKRKYYRNKVQRYIPLDLWRNLVLIGIETNNHLWVNKLIDKHEKDFNPDERNNIANYSRALVHFEMNRFDDSLNCINKVHHEYFSMKYDERNLILKIYYEMGYTSEAYLLIDSYLKSLKNINLNAERKLQYKNFLILIKNLLKYKELKDETGASMLVNKISKSKTISKLWLLEKAKELVEQLKDKK